MKSKLGYAYKRLVTRIETFSVMLGVKAGRPLVTPMLQLVGLLGRRIDLSVVKVTITFAFKIHRLYRKGGRRFVVIYLKACATVLQQVCGSQRVHDLTPFGVRFKRSHGGLPSIIPVLHRRRIIRGERWVTRFWMTMFGLYRVLIFIPKSVSFATVEDPCSMDPSSVLPNFSEFVNSHFLKSLPACWLVDTWRSEGGSGVLKGLRAKPFIISKASPAARGKKVSLPSTTPTGIISSAYIWRKSDLFPVLEDWCKLTGSIWVLNRLELWTSGLDPLRWAKLLKEEGTLGRLGLKLESAGKVRVYAMVDPWTQWLLYPIHDRIFELLSRIEEDGTRDQLAPVNRLLEKSGASGLPLYSFDLSAATDRLPLSLQKVLLSPLLTAWGAETWGKLLVGRPYVVESDEFKIKPRNLYYGTGQPMGAYSSWAMLALTHHAIVQWAALRAAVINRSGDWFADYAVLGDDVVIGNHDVAKTYLEIMDSLGVRVSLHKSLSSETGTALEFAKRFFRKKEDCSGAPIPEFVVARNSLLAMMELVKKYSLTLGQMLSVLGYGYRAKGKVNGRLLSLPSRIRNYVLAYYGPSGPKWDGFKTYLLTKSVGTAYEASQRKVTHLVKRMVEVERQALLQRLDSLAPLLEAMKRLVIVYRDREHYAGLGTDVVLQSDGWTPRFGSQSRIMDSLRETVYRDAFLDSIADLRNLRTQVEELDPSSAVPEGCEIFEKEIVGKPTRTALSMADTQARYDAAWEYACAEEYRQASAEKRDPVLPQRRLADTPLYVEALPPRAVEVVFLAPPIKDDADLEGLWAKVQFLYDSLTEIDEHIGSLPLPSGLIQRIREKSRVSEGQAIKRWYRYSTIFRKTTDPS